MGEEALLLGAEQVGPGVEHHPERLQGGEGAPKAHPQRGRAAPPSAAACKRARATIAMPTRRAATSWAAVSGVWPARGTSPLPRRLTLSSW